MTSASLKTGEQTTGSVWNKNSWHWEEKDYNKAAQAKLTAILESLVLTTPSGEKVVIKSVEPKGFASISVRKGKKVIVFEFSISMLFEGAGASGSLKIPEFSNDELEPTVRVELTSGDDSVKDFLRKQGTKTIRETLLAFIEFMNSVETGSDLIESDKARREKELEVAVSAAATRGDEKKRIADEVKAREQAQMANKSLVESSVWNVNSYHWETKKLDKWAVEELKTMYAQNSEFSDITISGEAENSIRKGKIISIFNLKISGLYKSTPFSIPQFSNEEGDDDCEDPKITCDKSEYKKDIQKPLHGFLAKLKSQ